MQYSIRLQQALGPPIVIDDDGREWYTKNLILKIKMIICEKYIKYNYFVTDFGTLLDNISYSVTGALVSFGKIYVEYLLQHVFSFECEWLFWYPGSGKQCEIKFRARCYVV